MMEKCEEHVVVGYKTRQICQGNRVIVELKICQNLEVQISVGSKSIKPSHFGIWDKMPNISSNSITALYLSIKCLKVCLGKADSSVDMKVGSFTQVCWSEACDTSSSRMVRHSVSCIGVLSIIGQLQQCVNCQKLFRCPKSKTIQDTSITSNVAHATISTAVTPKRSTTSHCDASVGTTPLKSPEDVLLKYFPYLKSQNKLLGLVTEQIGLAEQNDPRGRRYDKEMISLSLSLWCTSPKNYQKLRDSGFIMPSPTTLSLYKNAVEQKPGLNADMFRWMLKEAKRINLREVGYSGGLVLDEMNIQKDLQIVTRRGEWRLVGLKDMGEGSNAMMAMSKNKNELSLADHVMQFLFHGLTGFRMPFACFPTGQANACDIYLSVWAAISRQCDWGFHIEYISIDGSSNNRSFVKMLFCNDPLRNDMTLTNRANPSQKITIIPDPSHLIKKIRNSAFNSGHDSQHTRLLMVDESVIIWKHWEEAWEWCKDREINPVAPHHKLNKDYIYLTTQAKMRNIYAEETLNIRMLLLMEAYQASLPENEGKKLSATIQFLQKTSILVIIVPLKAAVTPD